MLTNAFNINDHGEILAKAAPVGFTPNDDADLGHLALLIPREASKWLEKVLGEEHERDKKHPDRIELPG